MLAERWDIGERHIARMRERGDLVRTFGNPNVRGGRMIRGVANTPALDTHGTRIWPAGLSAELPIPLLWKHEGAPIGSVVFVEVFDEVVVATATLFYDAEAAETIWRGMAGADLGLSIGFKPMRGAESLDCVSITKWVLTEISITDAPSNLSTWVRRYRPPVRLGVH